MSVSRSVVKLSRDWKFFRGEEALGFYKGLDDGNWRTVTVPHDWSVEEPFSKENSSGTGYLPGGRGWYRKSFDIPKEAEGSRVYITFEGVYNNSQVWCNSYYINKRPYGYSTFTYDITDFVSFGDNNVICVKVDHKDIADSRWFTGSGIYRDVYLTITNEVHIENYGVFVTTPEVTSDKAHMCVDVKIRNDKNSKIKVEIKNTLNDAHGCEVGTSSKKLEINAEVVECINQDINIENPKLWTPNTPYMYTLSTQIIENDIVIDEVQTPIGIRWFEFDSNRGFFLNGENMKLKGVCVHHDAGCLGAAVPDKVWIRRLKSLKEMGCNAIRMSHNPPSPNLLSMCDTMGFLVMDEAFDEWEGVKNKWSTGHNVYPPKHFGYYEDFPEWGERDIKEMVLRDRNHPSIILWSIGNEVDYPNDPYCHPSFKNMTGNNDANKPEAERQYDPNKPNAQRLAVIAKKLVSYVKECDTTRPVTAALAFPELSNLTGYASALDVVGYNYKEHLYSEDCKKYPDRVTYGSENSGSFEAWKYVRDNDNICGQFIWTGIDYLGEAMGWPVRVAQPGFLDVAGFKKPKYYYRKSIWNDEPMIYLSTRNINHFNYKNFKMWDVSDCHWNYNNDEMVEVVCYTNCDEVELFLNEESLGVKSLKAFELQYISWNVNYKAGILKAVGKAKDGKIYEYKLVSAAEPNMLVMDCDVKELEFDSHDIAHVEIIISDEHGNPVYEDERDIRVTVEGPAELLGLENGSSEDLEPYSSKHRKIYHGRLLAYVRATAGEGKIKVTAEADGVKANNIYIGVKLSQ